MKQCECLCTTYLHVYMACYDLHWSKYLLISTTEHTVAETSTLELCTSRSVYFLVVYVHSALSQLDHVQSYPWPISRKCLCVSFLSKKLLLVVSMISARYDGVPQIVFIAVFWLQCTRLPASLRDLRIDRIQLCAVSTTEETKGRHLDVGAWLLTLNSVLLLYC